jgi:hypothetical protein
MLKCEECGREFEENTYQSGRRLIEPCDFCGKKICVLCSHTYTLSDFSHITNLCSDCWRIGSEYRKQVSKLRETYYQNRKLIIDRWKLEVKNNNQKKGDTYGSR